jgi:hypothetical protein
MLCCVFLLEVFNSRFTLKSVIYFHLFLCVVQFGVKVTIFLFAYGYLVVPELRKLNTDL